jgi:hypothetical protein
VNRAKKVLQSKQKGAGQVLHDPAMEQESNNYGVRKYQLWYKRVKVVVFDSNSHGVCE